MDNVKTKHISSSIPVYLIPPQNTGQIRGQSVTEPLTCLEYVADLELWHAILPDGLKEAPRKLGNLLLLPSYAH